MKNIQASITGKYKVCGVMGDPIGHSFSPALHNRLNAHYNMEMVYVPFLVKSEGVADAIKGAHALGIRGLNVTMPHKKAVMPHLVAIDALATQADAVNTLVYTEAGYCGYNTDVEGLRMALAEEGISYSGKNVGIIGSGGAAYAAAVCVLPDAKSIHIFNRTVDNAKQLQAHIGACTEVPIEVYSLEENPNVPLDIVIQTTGVGMGKLIGEMPSCSERLLADATCAVDLIYNPVQTKFLAYAQSKGLKTMNGYGMLFYQGVLAYEKMNGISCDPVALQAIKKEIEDGLR